MRYQPSLGERPAGDAGFPDPNVLNPAIIVLLLLGSAALIGGLVIALLASRRAPDGFEDQEGFHLGRLPPAGK